MKSTTQKKTQRETEKKKEGEEEEEEEEEEVTCKNQTHPPIVILAMNRWWVSQLGRWPFFLGQVCLSFLSFSPILIFLFLFYFFIFEIVRRRRKREVGFPELWDRENFLFKILRSWEEEGRRKWVFGSKNSSL